ncbi:MAG: DUF7544 domain-containing protein [Terriglobia bacterium]
MELIPENPAAGTAQGEQSRTRREFSAASAASAAAHDSVDLLLRPFNAGQWVKFSLLCLVLGGGTPSAAFDWSLGALPGDISLEQFAARVREYLAQHLWLVAVAVGIVLGTSILILFLRASFRMVLVGSIIRRRLVLNPVWGETRTFRHSYFRWLIGTLGSAGVFVTVISLLSFPYLRVSAAVGLRSVLFWIMLGAILALDILVGVALAVVVTLTDDLVVPIMYAERITVLPAWKRLSEIASREPWTFLTYLLWRFALSLALGILVMFLVFSAILTLFSGAVITAASVVLTLHAWGMKWVWNAATVAIAAGGMGVLMMVVVLVLSLVAMPGQVFLQDFGMRFIAARLPSLEVLLIRPDFQVSSFEDTGEPT